MEPTKVGYVMLAVAVLLNSITTCALVYIVLHAI
jgi:hypothetical protein